jgi:hypothetical protein
MWPDSIMIHVDAHSHFGTFDYENDEKQAKLTLLLTAMMAVISVALITAGVYAM